MGRVWEGFGAGLAGRRIGRAAFGAGCYAVPMPLLDLVSAPYIGRIYRNHIWEALRLARDFEGASVALPPPDFWPGTPPPLPALWAAQA